MAISSEVFRKIMGLFATGVTVVTARTGSGQPWGFTVNSFTSVSLAPPLILFCVGNGSDSSPVVERAEYFGVNYLSEAQEEISRRFAARGVDRFAGLRYGEGAHGSPLLEGCLGFVECRKVTAHAAGDHTIILCEVLDGEVGEGNPLLFFRSAYARMGPPASR